MRRASRGAKDEWLEPKMATVIACDHGDAWRETPKKKFGSISPFHMGHIQNPPGATLGICTEVHHPDGADPDWTPGLKSRRSPGLFQKYAYKHG